MDLMAVIVAKMGPKIAKVQCKTCKKERAYKPPKGVNEPGAQPPAGAVSKKRTRAGQNDGNAEAQRTVSVEAEWKRLMNEAEKAARVKYSPKSILKQGDVVQHPTFGEGIVMRVAHPDKAEILFQNDLKLLIHSRN